MENLEKIIEPKEHVQQKKEGHFIRTKHLLGVLGLGTGATMGEADVLDRLNDYRTINTPIGVSSGAGSHGSILNVITNNPYFHDFSHVLYTLGISGGPNNTLGILAAAGSLTVGGIAARSYIHSKDTKTESTGEKRQSGYKTALLSGGFFGVGGYIGSQSFLSVINGTLYGAPTSTLGYAGAAVLSMFAGVHLGMHYLKDRFSEKNVQ